MESCILVATDCDAQATAALRVAHEIAVRSGRPLEVVSVCEPLSVYAYESDDLVAGVRETMAEQARTRREDIVRDRIAAAGITTDVPVHIVIGAPAPSIARVARERSAHLVVAGPGDHSTGDRVLHDETALQLIQSSHVPVLTIPQNREGLPDRVMAAVDFTSFSLDAAWTAAAMLASGAELHLAHVVADRSSVDLSSWRETEWMRKVGDEARSRLEMLEERIRAAHPHLRVSSHLLDAGRPVPALLRLAEDLEVDLIATGTNGYGFLGRLLLGSVATQLVRRTRCMTLVAPPRPLVSGGGEVYPLLGGGRRKRGDMAARRPLPAA